MIKDDGLDRMTRSAAYRVLLAWAGSKGTTFRMCLQRHMFRDTARLRRLEALGQVEGREHVPFSRLNFPTRLRAVIDALVWLGQTPPDAVRIAGPLVAAVIKELADDLTPPRGAEGGDLGAAQDLEIYEGSQELYSARQYACLQTLQLSEERVAEVRNALKEAGVSPALLQRLDNTTVKVGHVKA